MAQDTRQLNTPAASAEPVVRVRQLSRRFGERIILDRIDLDIRQGEFVALLGHSGSGKSTFLRALAGLDYAVEGDGGIAVPPQLSVVFQDARLLPWKSVLDNVAYGLRGPLPRQRAVDTLREVGLAGRERAWPGDLSGGEQQRVALARALVRSPQLLLADEPFGALDALTRLRMHDLLRRLCRHHQPAVLLITHDVDEAIHLADRVLVLDHGRLTIDEPVRLPEGKAERLARIAALRGQLLAGLGVRDADDDAGAQAGEAAAAVKKAA